MAPKRAQKTGKTGKTSAQVVSEYDLRKVHIPLVLDDGSTNYVPRAAQEKAKKLRERLLTRSAQGQSKRIRSGGPISSPPPLSSLPPLKKKTKPMEAPAVPTAAIRAARTAARPKTKPKTKGKTAAKAGEHLVTRRPVHEPAGAEQGKEQEEEQEEEQKEIEEEQEEIEEEEDQKEREDGDDGNVDLARELFAVNEKFKQKMLLKHLRKQIKGFRKEVPDITTSDVEEELSNIVKEQREVADFPIDITIRMYIGKILKRTKSLPGTTRESLDLAEIELLICKEISAFEEDPDLEIVNRKAVIRANTNRAQNRVHDLEDFSIEEADRVLSMADAAREQHPRSKILLLLEIRLADLPKTRPSKRSRPETDPENSSPPPSSPPVRPAKKPGHRTSKLAEQQAVRLDKIALAGDFERQLMDKWTCRSKECTNHEGLCYPDPLDRLIHYAISAVSQKSWATAISAGECTLLQPPLKLWTAWKQEQGPITRESRASTRKSFQQKTTTTLEELQEQVERTRFQNQLAAEQAKIDQAAEREEERRWRHEEKMEEREARREEQEAERLRRKDLEEQVRQRRERERELQTGYTQPNLPHHTHYTVPFQPHILPVPSPPVQQPVIPSASYSVQQSPTRRSSPMSTVQTDWEVLRKFFHHKQLGQRPEYADKWQRAWLIVEDQDWSIQDLKNMADDRSAIYQRAREAGISDGFARRFADELRQFKQIVREEEAAAGTLTGAQEAGGFI